MAEKVEFYRETEFKDTEIGRIPKEWEVAQLGSENVSIFIKSGSTPLKKVKEYWNGNIPFVTQSDMTKVDRYLYETSEKITDLGLKNSNLLLIPEDSVLLSMYGTIGKVVINKTPVAISQNIAAIILNKKNVNHEYLFYVVQKYSFQLKRRAKIITLKHLDIQIIKNMLLPFPSLQEQQKIAEILSTVDEAIQKTDDIIAKTERLKKGLMQELFTKGIGHNEFKDTEIGRIPKEWEVKKIREIGELSRGLSYRGQEKFAEEVTGGYLFLTLNSIKEGGGLKEDGWSWIRTDRLRERHFVREGDIVIANTDIGMQRGHILGAPALIYFPSWYRKDRAVYSMDLSKLQLKSNLHHKFLFYYLSYVQPIARKYHTGTNVWHLNLDAWSNELSIPLPPLHEQQKIAEILSTVDKKLEILKQEKVKLERIKQWFMEELLTGRIRVRVA